MTTDQYADDDGLEEVISKLEDVRDSVEEVLSDLENLEERDRSYHTESPYDFPEDGNGNGY